MRSLGTEWRNTVPEREDILTLVAELGADIALLDELAAKNADALTRVRAGATDELDYAALGYTIHNIYSLVEGYAIHRRPSRGTRGFPSPSPRAGRRARLNPSPEEDVVLGPKRPEADARMVGQCPRYQRTYRPTDRQ